MQQEFLDSWGRDIYNLTDFMKNVSNVDDSFNSDDSYTRTNHILDELKTFIIEGLKTIIRFENINNEMLQTLSKSTTIPDKNLLKRDYMIHIIRNVYIH